MHQVFMSLSVLWTITTFAAATMAGEEQAKAAADDACRIEVLNNLVSELMDAGKRGLLGQREIAFVNPRKGWCFFTVAGNGVLTLDGENRPLAMAKGSATVEAMRYLPAGRHTLKLTGRAAKLVVRAIPGAGVQLLPGGANRRLRRAELAAAAKDGVGQLQHDRRQRPLHQGNGRVARAGKTVGHLERRSGAERLPMEDGYAYRRKPRLLPSANERPSDRRVLSGFSSRRCSRTPSTALPAWRPIRPSATGSGFPLYRAWRTVPPACG